MDAKQELEELRKLEALEQKASKDEPAFGDRMATSLYAGAQKLGAGGFNLPVTLGRGINWALDKAGVPKKSGGMLERFIAPNELDEIGENADTTSKKSGIQNPYGRAVIEAAAGGFLMPGYLAAAPVKTAVMNGIPAVSGEGAAQAFSDNGVPSEKARLIAGLLTGLGSGWALGPKQSVARADIKRELDGVSPQYFTEAQKNYADFKTAGATTATAAELFPGNTRIATLAQNAANSKGGEALAQQLARRTDDLSAMSQRIPGTAGGNPSVPEAARDAAESAQRRIQTRKDAAQRPLNLISRDEANGVLPYIPDSEMNTIFKAFQKRSADPRLPAADAAARKDFLPEFLDANAPTRTELRPGKVASVKVQPPSNLNPASKQTLSAPGLTLTEQPGFQTSLASLLLNISENSTRAAGPLAAAGVTIPKRATGQAQQLAFDAVKTLPLPWGARAADAGENYLKRKEAWVTPVEGGTLGRISGNKNELRGPVSEGKLAAVLEDVVAGKTSKVMKELGKGGADLKGIASALLASSLEKAPTDFSKVLRGNAGSPAEKQLFELLASAGGNPSQLKAILNTGDQMQQLGSAKSIKSMPEMRTLQWLIRPLRTADMITTGATEVKIQTEIARLLKDPNNLDEIEKIAKFDPRVRRGLTALAGTNALIQGTSNIKE